MLRGHFYRLRLPSQKPRPALVISVNSRNRAANTVVVVQATTQPARIQAWHVEIAKGDGRLPRKSVLRCENIALVPRSCLAAKPLGPPVSATKMRAVEQAIKDALELP